MYAWVYWGELDHLSHIYGPDDERTVAEFASFSTAFERLFLSRLSPELRRDTLVILTADHGQINTQKYSNYDLNHHPEFTRRLHLQPTGENRMAYLYLRPGQYDGTDRLPEAHLAGPVHPDRPGGGGGSRLVRAGQASPSPAGPPGRCDRRGARQRLLVVGGQREQAARSPWGTYRPRKCWCRSWPLGYNIANPIGFI